MCADVGLGAYFVLEYAQYAPKMGAFGLYLGSFRGFWAILRMR